MRPGLAQSSSGRTSRTPFNLFHEPDGRLTASDIISPALLVAGLGTWAFGMSHTNRQAIGPYGVLASASPWFIVGLVLLLAGALAELGRSRPRAWVFIPLLAGLIVAIYTTVPILDSGTPEYSWVYKHVGVASEFGLYGRVTDTLNIYQEWPALFTLVASVSSLGGTGPLSFAAWGPVAFELADALVLLGIFRLFTGDRRLSYFAVLLYEGLIAWVGQDYLSPQAFGYLLWLGIVTVILRWLQVPARPSRLKLVSAVRGALLADRPEPARASTRMRAVALLLVAVIYFAIVSAHQLTPYMALFAVAVLVLLGTLWRGWLTLLLLAVTAVGFLAPRYGLISQQFGGLFSGGDIFENASGVGGIVHKGAEASTGRVVHLLAACMWLAALGAVAFRWRSLGRVAVPAALAFSPFFALLMQSYGGEAIYRVFLFSAPWCALLIAGLIAQLRNVAWRRVAAAVACVAALGAGLQGLYGPVAVDAFTPAELAASLWLYDNAAPGSLLVLAADNFPAVEVGDYSSYDIQVMPADPQYGPSWLNEASVTEVEQYLASLGHRTAYVVFSRSMSAYVNYFGYPTGYARLASEVMNRPSWQVVYRNRDVVIYRVTLA